MWHTIVCEKLEEEEWHKKKCLYGQCNSCNVDEFPFCLVEINGSTEALVEWKRFAMEIKMLIISKTLKRLTFVYKKLLVMSLLITWSQSYKTL